MPENKHGEYKKENVLSPGKLVVNKVLLPERILTNLRNNFNG